MELVLYTFFSLVLSSLDGDAPTSLVPLPAPLAHLAYYSSHTILMNPIAHLTHYSSHTLVPPSRTPSPSLFFVIAHPCSSLHPSLHSPQYNTNSHSHLHSPSHTIFSLIHSSSDSLILFFNTHQSTQPTPLLHTDPHSGRRITTAVATAAPPHQSPPNRAPAHTTHVLLHAPHTSACFTLPTLASSPPPPAHPVHSCSQPNKFPPRRHPHTALRYCHQRTCSAPVAAEHRTRQHRAAATAVPLAVAAHHHCRFSFFIANKKKISFFLYFFFNILILSTHHKILIFIIKKLIKILI